MVRDARPDPDVAATAAGAWPTVELSLPCMPSSASSARRWLSRELRTALPQVTTAARPVDDVSDAAELLVCEVVTNAVVHARSAPLVRATVGTDRVHVEVHDTSARPPEHHGRDEDELATSGRGLDLLDLLSDAWGWHRTTTGKAVWFRLDTVAG